MNGIPMEHGLLLAAVLFCIGLCGLLIRRNLLFKYRDHDERVGTGIRGGWQPLGPG